MFTKHTAASATDTPVRDSQLQDLRAVAGARRAALQNARVRSDASEAVASAARHTGVMRTAALVRLLKGAWA